MTKKAERLRARELRKQGYSLKEIAAMVGVAKSSVSVWCRDLKLTPEQREKVKQRVRPFQTAGARANKIKWLEIRQEYQAQGRVDARNGDWLHLAGCMLYWGEGSKSRGRLYFANSDPDMMVIYMRFLRESLQVPEDQIKMSIYTYLGNGLSQEEIEQYWIDLLDIDRERMHKNYFDTQPSSSQQKGRKLLYGVCHVRVASVEHVQRVYGAIQEYIGIDKPEWVE